jgi:hypothetical protein
MTSSDWSPSPKLARWLIAAALLPFAAIVFARWSQPPAATDGDYAHYLLHAKAIAESRPYTDIGYIYTRMNLVGPEVQPPGWPLVLSPFVAVFGTDSPVFKVLVTLLVAGFGIMVGLYFVRRNQPILGFAGAAAGPVALEVQYATSSALSDPLFCTLVWLTLLLADADGPIGWRRGVGLAFLCLAVMSVRVAGVAMLPALLLYATLKDRDTRLKLILPLVTALAVLVLVAWLGFDRIPFLDRLLNNLRNLSLILFLRTYVLALAAGALYPVGINLADDLYHVLAIVPMLIGGLLLISRGYRTALVSFALVYAGVLLISPVREPRYAWPLIPLVMIFMTDGLLWLGERVASGRLRHVAPKLVLGFVAVVTASTAIHIARRPARLSLVGDQDTMALFEWVRSTRDTMPMRVVFTNPRVLTLETDVPAMGIPFGNRDAVVAELDRQRITHVVVPIVHLQRESERNLRRFVSERPTQFPEVFVNASHDVRRFIPRPSLPQPADSGSVVVARPQ